MAGSVTHSCPEESTAIPVGAAVLALGGAEMTFFNWTLSKANAGAARHRRMANRRDIRILFSVFFG